MNHTKHNPLLNRLRKGRVMFLLLIFVIVSGWCYVDSSIETGPYNLVYPTNFGNRVNIPADNPTTKQGVYLGRMLFYETKLSSNNKLSCSSCHQQDKAFTDGRAFSPGVDGILTPRNSMSLVNLLWARKFFWDGRANGLEEQAMTPLTSPHEMGQSLTTSAQKLTQATNYPTLFKLVYGDEKITGDRIVKAISQFERTLISANSRYDQYLRGAYQPTPDELKGMELFNTMPHPEKGIRGANCSHCHGGPKTYMELFHNNGLDSLPKDSGMEILTRLPADRGRFKVPTLRNIAFTAPYMHDGRFKTLEEVVDHYSEHIEQSASLSSFLQGESNEPGGKRLKLLPVEKKQLIAFLNMLTDSTFITNPAFSDPHLLSTKNKKH
ncbi:cytochrome-c peroxidase [Mucilaginibacter lappiensis]|uniref:Cytochrome c peroxidase n=1 Tax=Mucilaginibacter lappiensis TaxID=354630 RepID=A0A841JLF2_9SPHI|nr:cytochrome c peroxidase [Mucilaginibacter lappiensis]MBB6131850.1 cytochrome c peroxidase [Mucilaginibacter lappiensis]